jgi:hypothetical protein
VSLAISEEPSNRSTMRVIEKLGMVFEPDVVAQNDWPSRLYRLTREQWASGDERPDSRVTGAG